jgi:hypothetical protein
MDESNGKPWPVELSRRAAACVRACEGIPTDRLEHGVLIRLVAACVHVADERVREILEEMSPRPTAASPDRARAVAVRGRSYSWRPQSSRSRARISSTPSTDIGRPTQ